MEYKTLDFWIKLFPFAGAAVAFIWGVGQYIWNEKKQAETRRVEATKPFLERQLTLYTEATRAAATLATSEDPEDRDRALKQFWSLYWGELALVEDKGVESAMVQMALAVEESIDSPRRQRLYKDAEALATTLKASEDFTERAEALREFWSQYWGDMLNGMGDHWVFGHVLESKPVNVALGPLSRLKLEQRSLQLARACRDSLARSWGVKAWQNPT